MPPIRSGRRLAKRGVPVPKVKCKDAPKLSYQYKRLRHPDEIRLLVLAPGTGFNTLECKLVHTRMSSNPNYEALSYAWGDSSKPKQIVCSNQIIRITQSLYSALRHLRDPTKSRIIWADAICINQKTSAEKNHQVTLMGKIYSQAEKTLAWIGEAEDHIVHNAFDFLDRLNEYFGSCLEGYNTKKLCTDSFDVPQQALTEFSTNWVSELYSCLGPLFAFPWFKRLWIVQEVVLAKVVEVAFGTQVLPLNKMTYPALIIKAFAMLKDIPNSFDRGALVNLARMGGIRELHKQYQQVYLESAPFAILSTLDRLHHFEATDPRDKIYALLGLGYTPGYIADYNLSINDVFRNFAIWCLEAEPDSLQVLSYAGLSQVQSALASWVPTYNSNRINLKLFEINNFHASKSTLADSSSSEREKTWHLSDGSVLDLRGGYVDDVGVIARFPLSTRLKKTLRALREIFEVAKCSQNTLANERYHKLCRAMTAELGQFKKGASPKQVECSHYLFQLMLDSSLAGEEFNSAEMDSFGLLQVSSKYLSNKKFCLTSHDRFAWIPELSEVGDKIFILRGARVPFVLRPLRDGKYALVGECWVQGLMEGEALSLPHFKWEDISLV